MNDFASMTMTELVRPEGYDCACGCHHTAPMEYINIGRGVINQVAEMVKKLGCARPFVVCDQNTYAVAGEKVCALLSEADIPYSLHIIPGKRISPAEWEVGSVIMHFDTKCDLVLGVGSGVVNDICKVVAFTAGLKSAIVGTAPSMDGYASNSSAMEVNHVKSTLYNRSPMGILLDTEIMAQAPERMLWAGVGDMVAKYIAICEWRISHIVTGEFYCENIANLMRTAVKRVTENALGVVNRDPDAIQSVAEGFIISGITMAYLGSSRPASGLEHYFSHMWEMFALEQGKQYDLHGIMVGIGTVLTMKLYKEIKKLVPNREKALEKLAAFDEGKWADEIRRIFGSTADEMFALENKAHKNDSEKIKAKIDKICAHWDEILKIIDEELPDYDTLYTLLEKTGMPMRPSDIGMSLAETADAFKGSRDERDKYLTSTLLWDMGLTDEFIEILKNIAETGR